jgi:hypothetical protein
MSALQPGPRPLKSALNWAAFGWVIEDKNTKARFFEIPEAAQRLVRIIF